MKTKIIFIIGISILIFILYKTLQVPDQVLHYHANFAVFINEKQVDFSGSEFMHITPCGPEEEHNEDGEEEKVHLHDNVGNVAHVHHDNVTWSDLFKNLRFDLTHIKTEQATKAATIKYYLSGVGTSDVLNKVIGKDDRLLVSIGQEKSVDNVTGDEILKRQFEKVGNNAKDYDAGKKGKETCGGSGQRTLFERMKIAFGML